MSTRVLASIFALSLLGCAHLPQGASGVALGAMGARADEDLDALDRQFQQMRPAAKARFLKKLDAGLKARWDAYQKAHQQAFADAHPPVAALGAEAEQALRQALLHLPGAQLKANLKAAVDCDGSGPAYGDKDTDFETSVAFQGQPLNADRVLYHVRPLGHSELDNAVAINFYGGRMVPSVYGDAGPAWGEASHLVIQQLGLPSSPINGGDEHHHDMVFLPGLGAAFMATGQEPTPENLGAFLGARGVPGFPPPAPGLTLAP